MHGQLFLTFHPLHGFTSLSMPRLHHNLVGNNYADAHVMHVYKGKNIL